MNPEECQRAAEQWLDEALDLCKAASPRIGLETRILAHLQARATRRKQRWILALAASTALLFALTMVRVIESRRDAALPNSSPATQVSNTPGATPGNTARGPSRATMPVVQPCAECGRKQSTKKIEAKTVPAALVAEVKQQLFPSPIPLSEERDRLQLYLQQTPKQELHRIAQRQRSAPVPALAIAPIEIKELTPIEDLDPKGNL